MSNEISTKDKASLAEYKKKYGITGQGTTDWELLSVKLINELSSVKSEQNKERGRPDEFMEQLWLWHDVEAKEDPKVRGFGTAVKELQMEGKYLNIPTATLKSRWRKIENNFKKTLNSWNLDQGLSTNFLTKLKD